MPLGAFIYFLKEPPPELAARSWHFGLTADGFRRLQVDPLKAIRDVPKEVEGALTFRNGCVYCHAFAAWARAAITCTRSPARRKEGLRCRSKTTRPKLGGKFLFNQVEVAKKMGATPNLVRESARQPLFDLVN